MVLTNSSLRPTRSANETLFTLDVVQVGSDSLSRPSIFIAVRLAENCQEGSPGKIELCYIDFARHAYL